ncbi:signal peptide peptidase SppA [Thermomonospora curvata]|uniref:Signal peptide peptidase SppA, 67K type n=1 Tax=Thermomonospora curvata (strain ATCC 19995 / DSM 43183 / JCM 3096 / KCTC 9072 / NBRC 15933 / NCIMB 10081 / Henssen B9) TaxID=471852 RepID=D1ABW9_THECD|nr:signal peptide peptidase SppA [Thermomonospora curvata]ACY99142.1 signal peptide peptidase SppA, 67K type [Thermomonospora curvata DSM 43183]
MVEPGKIVSIVKQARDRRTAPLVLELDLADGIVEAAPADPLSALLSMRRTHLRDVLDGLRKARGDARVRALIVRVGGTIGLAMAQELRDAVTALRQAGKLTVAWSETFGEGRQGNVPYYLASAFDRVYLQPTGEVGLTGVALEEPFLRGALEKAGIEPRFAARHEYKTVANMFMERAYTPEHRESSQRLVDSAGRQLAEGIAQGRGLTVERVRELIDRGPLLAAEALEAGLVDRLAYRDEVYAEVREKVGGPDGRVQLRYVSRYNRTHGLAEHLPQPGRQDAVALINGLGPIRLGRSGRGGPLPSQGPAMGSDTIGAAFRAAVRDERIKAIVFRVNSPGGSAVASDAIWREVVLARRAGKPVIVSMGDVAASGGYYVAMAADVIVAQPGTITGSIGVVTGKAVLSGLLERIGVGMGSVTDGEHALMYSAIKDFSPSEWERINASLDHIYENFTAKVAEGRGLSRRRVEELARGRVWTGADAKEHGLVDELGGLELALELARKKAGLPADAPVRTFPHLGPLERLRPAESSEDRAAASARFDGWGSLASLAARLGLPAAGPLTLPGSWEIR